MVNQLIFGWIPSGERYYLKDEFPDLYEICNNQSCSVNELTVKYQNWRLSFGQKSKGCPLSPRRRNVDVQATALN